jgi:hypothetical protein
VTLVVREGFVPDELIALARRDDLDPGEQARLAAVKREMAERVPARPADEVYDVAAFD